jgi:hypothetical protein
MGVGEGVERPRSRNAMAYPLSAIRRHWLSTRGKGIGNGDTLYRLAISAESLQILPQAT